MPKSYYLNKIRVLLTEGFTDKELRRFTFETPGFRTVYNQLAQDHGKDEIIDRLLEYSDRTEKFEPLLEWAKKNNLTKYNQHKPYCCARILLVDDNKDMCDQLVGLLQEKWDYEVVATASKEEAIQRIKDDEPYNLAILDMRLDEADEENREGVRLGEWLRDNGYNLPIIIMSAYAMDTNTMKKMTLRPLQFAVVEKGKIGSGDLADLLRQIELALLS